VQLQRREFNGQTDLIEMQTIVMERTQTMGRCTNLHPGDIAHRIYSGSRMWDLEDVVRVWKDDAGMVGFGIIWPKDATFDVVTRIGLAESDRRAIIATISDLAARDGRVQTDVIGEDTSFTSILSELGFHPDSAEYVFTAQSLDTPVAIPPHDFVVRSVNAGDAEQLAAVHSGAFGSRWTPDEYARRMRQPGYNAVDEIVAVDADGTFMGFTNTWYDDVNRIGCFEPVGVHKYFHRRGVGTVLLREGMARMRARGMTTATVWHTRSEERATEFYRSNGFEICNAVTRWDRMTIGIPIPVIS
jgi:predicted N-acetyltransferase YhbS